MWLNCRELHPQMGLTVLGLPAPWVGRAGGGRGIILAKQSGAVKRLTCDCLAPD